LFWLMELKEKGDHKSAALEMPPLATVKLPGGTVR